MLTQREVTVFVKNKEEWYKKDLAEWQNTTIDTDDFWHMVTGVGVYVYVPASLEAERKKRDAEGRDD